MPGFAMEQVDDLRQPVPPCNPYVVDDTDRSKIYLKTFPHRSNLKTLRVQIPGQCSPKSVIMYSRGPISKNNEATWPDKNCLLSNAIVAELLLSDIPIRDLDKYWKETFTKGDIRLKRPNIGQPAFTTNTESSTQDESYAVYRQPYLLCGDRRVNELLNVWPNNIPWLVRTTKEATELYANNKKVGCYVVASNGSKTVFLPTEPTLPPSTLERVLESSELTDEFKEAAYREENKRRARFQLPPLKPPVTGQKRNAEGELDDELAQRQLQEDARRAGDGQGGQRSDEQGQ